MIANSGNLWLTGKEAALRSQGESCSPPQLSDITFDAILIGQVNFREDVVSELHCMDLCVRRSSCVAYNMETAGSHVRCTILSDIQKSEKKLGSLYRNFDREKIEKVCVYYFIVKQCYISKNISQGKGNYKDDHSLINEPSDRLTPPSPPPSTPSRAYNPTFNYCGYGKTWEEGPVLLIERREDWTGQSVHGSTVLHSTSLKNLD